MIEALGSYSFSVTILVAAGAVLASVAAVRFQSDRALQAARWPSGSSPCA